MMHNPHFFLLPIQYVDLFFCNNLSLGKDRILEFVNSESAQNFNINTTFLRGNLVECNRPIS